MAQEVKRPKRITRLTRPRRVSVPRLDPGDGNVIQAWVEISEQGIEIRKFGSSKTRWYLPLRQAAEAIARAAQVRECRLLGKPEKREGEAGPIFSE